ncbi:MAG: cysteine-rich repeat protein [Myxococcota bacterium]|jgi:cysteine-rich repeat protein
MRFAKLPGTRPRSARMSWRGAVNGSFNSNLIGGYPFTCQGAFTYLNFVVGFGALAFGGTGPTTLTSSVPLEELGKFDGFGTNLYTAVDGDKTIQSPQSGDNTGLQFFLIPHDATSIIFQIEDEGSAPDSFGFWLGAVDLNVGTCQGSGATAQYITKTCGDGVRRDGEGCDDGNTADNDGCSAACTLEPGGGCGGNAQCTAAQPSPTCTCTAENSAVVAKRHIDVRPDAHHVAGAALGLSLRR